jgi:hypothetical protein
VALCEVLFFSVVKKGVPSIWSAEFTSPDPLKGDKIKIPIDDLKKLKHFFAISRMDFTFKRTKRDHMKQMPLSV